MTTIVTLRLDEVSQAHFDALRQLHFPPERNQIAAHVTLFHTLPEEAWVEEQLQVTAAATQRFFLDVTGLQFLGKGVAYRLQAAELLHLHTELARSFAEDLTPQDRQRFQPHVVVQNKVAPVVARELMKTLEEGLSPWKVRADGLDLWHYKGGPWEHARSFWFTTEARQ